MTVKKCDKCGKTYEKGELVAYVQKLEKENAELKKKLNVFSNESANACFAHNEKSKQLTKAKEIIKTFCGFCGVFNSTNGSLDNIIAKAEQFLSEVEK